MSAAEREAQSQLKANLNGSLYKEFIDEQYVTLKRH
jgi:hypothetical protein